MNQPRRPPLSEFTSGFSIIALTQGRFSLADPEDVPVLSRHRWTAIHSGHTWYAKARIDGRTHYMHRLITLGPERCATKFKVDHINRNGLDNRRKNLRLVSHAENLMNSVGRPATRKSRFKGVSVLGGRDSRPFRATIHLNGRQRHLGYFDSEVDAAQAYDEAAQVHFGAYARLNFAERIAKAA